MRVGEHNAANKPTGEPERARYLALAILATCVLGTALRALHLDLPMRYDETVTYVSYAAQGWEHVTTNYQSPNNHVFHSVLVAWLTSWLGDAPLVIRLPAFLAGCMLVPAAAWVAYRVQGRETALLAAVLVATSPVLIEFSANARGYSIVSLCVLLAAAAGWALHAGAGWLAWLAWIELGVVGLFTIPMAAIPWLGLTAWLAWGLARGAAPGARVRALVPWAASTAIIGVITLLLYSGILRAQGAEALMGNRFVATQPGATFLAATPGALAEVMRHWMRGVPLPLLAILLGCVVVGLRDGASYGGWRRLLGALGVGALVTMLVVRNWGEARIWQWAVPFVSITAAAGAVAIGRRLAPARPAAWGLVVASAWAGVMTAQVVFADPVSTSRDTGATPEVAVVFDSISTHYRQGDVVVGDFVSVEPLRYYLARWARVNEPPPRAAMERVWIVVNWGDSVRAANVRSRLARIGVPPLEEIRPFVAAGDVSVHLLGRPSGAPDPRLLEAIDWQTGAAGYVDEARAHALTREVAEETRSPVARAWLARCAALGCMGLPGGEPGLDPSGEVMSELRELALAGDVEAAFLVGSALEEGWGAQVDSGEAALWYGRASEAGHALATTHLARLGAP